MNSAGTLDLSGLRDLVLELMDSPVAGERYTATALHAAIVRRSDGQVFVGKTTFVGWFGPKRLEPSLQILHCIPALSSIFHMPPLTLMRAAGIPSFEAEAAISLSDAAAALSDSMTVAEDLLSRAGLAINGEALIVEKILAKQLDYRIMVWPVVRGVQRPIHLRTWIALTPVQSQPRLQRESLRHVQAQSIPQQKDLIRREVIGPELWRSFGLRWRDTEPLEWPKGERSDLRIELPVDEKIHKPTASAVHLGERYPNRLLVLTGLWGHAETLAMLVGRALGWGTFDLRYLGLANDELDETKQRLLDEKLREQKPFYAWSIAEPAPVVREIRDSILRAANHHIVILAKYGDRVAEVAERAWGVTPDEVSESQEIVTSIAREINRTHPIIEVSYDDRDLSHGDGDEVDANLYVEQIRYSAAEVLDHLRVQCGGPKVTGWGSRFKDLVVSNRVGPEVPKRFGTVRWRRPISPKSKAS